LIARAADVLPEGRTPAWCFACATHRSAGFIWKYVARAAAGAVIMPAIVSFYISRKRLTIWPRNMCIASSRRWVCAGAGVSLEGQGKSNAREV